MVMNGLYLFVLCFLVVCALTLVLGAVVWADGKQPKPDAEKPVKPMDRGARMCARRQSRTRLGELLKCSHPEWN
jgi:hypothetical protein